MYLSVESSLDGSSDHTPIISTVSTNVIYRELRQTLYNNKTDWESFSEYIETHTDLNVSLKTEEQVENATGYITNLIQEAAWRATPSLEVKKDHINYPLKIRELIQEKRRLRRVWHLSRNPRDKTAFNKAQLELKLQLQQIRNDTFQEQLKTLSATRKDDYSLWKIAKSYRRPQQAIPPLKTQNGWARDCKEKAELFADYLESVFKSNSRNPSISEEEIDTTVNSDQQMSLPLKLVTPKEVVREIRALKLNKAPGFDLITAEVLKRLPRKGIVFLTILFNSIIRMHYFPNLWKVSVINMVAKPGKPPNEVASYRPISLLPVISKLFEKIFLSRLKPCLEDTKVVPDHQFGFRSNHSTIEQVHRVAHKIRQSLEKKEYCSAVFLDIQQAFDRVWHKGLFFKLKNTLPNSAYMVLRSYLSQRSFLVKSGEEYSAVHPIEAGVPQGSVLGPVLYTIYTADLPLSDDVLTATYADDTAIIASNSNPIEASAKLQDHLNEIDHWLSKWRINVSATKSNHITFALRKGDCPPVQMRDEILPHKSCVKYLGMHLDRRLTWKDHIKAKRLELNMKFKNILWLIGRQSSLSQDNKLLIYKTMLKPIWTYGIELWGTASHSNVEILQRFQNNVLRTISSSPWFIRTTEIHEHLEMPTIKEEIRTHCTKYKYRLDRHINELAHNLIDTTNNVTRLKRVHILDLDKRQ